MALAGPRCASRRGRLVTEQSAEEAQLTLKRQANEASCGRPRTILMYAATASGPMPHGSLGVKWRRTADWSTSSGSYMARR